MRLARLFLSRLVGAIPRRIHDSATIMVLINGDRFSIGTAGEARAAANELEGLAQSHAVATRDRAGEDAFAGVRERLATGKADAADQAIAAAALLAFHRQLEERSAGWTEAFEAWRAEALQGGKTISNGIWTRTAFEAGYRARKT